MNVEFFKTYKSAILVSSLLFASVLLSACGDDSSTSVYDYEIIELIDDNESQEVPDFAIQSSSAYKTSIKLSSDKNQSDKKNKSCSSNINSSSSNKDSAKDTKVSSSSEKSEDDISSNSKNASSSSAKSSSSNKESSSSVKSSSSATPSSSSFEKSSSSLLFTTGFKWTIKSGDKDKSTCVTEGLVLYDLDDDYNIVGRICKSGSWEPLKNFITENESHYDMSKQFNSNITYAEFVDKRDNQIYKTVQYYSIFEIFAENLNFGRQIMKGDNDFDDEEVEKFCYNDDPWFCENGFGGLYTWSEAMGLPKACDTIAIGTSEKCKSPLSKDISSEYEWQQLQVQGICPDGWHIMNQYEWNRLVTNSMISILVQDLVSEMFYDPNSEGTSLLLSGYLSATEKPYYDLISETGIIWLPKQTSANTAYEINYNDQYARFNNLSKKIAASIRCVRNYNF